MSTRFRLSLALTALLAAPALGQTPGIPGAVGSGPRTDVQLSPNGTIDVGGARGTDIDLTGENLRGNLGASRIAPSPMAPPPAPGMGGPAWRPPGGGAEFGAGLVPRTGSTLGKGSAEEESREASIEDLILPRFRSAANGGAPASRSSADATADWRYRYFRGRWWYWQPAGSWLFWNGSAWQAR